MFLDYNLTVPPTSHIQPRRVSLKKKKQKKQAWLRGVVGFEWADSFVDRFQTFFFPQANKKKSQFVFQPYALKTYFLKLNRQQTLSPNRSSERNASLAATSMVSTVYSAWHTLLRRQDGCDSPSFTVLLCLLLHAGQMEELSLSKKTSSGPFTGPCQAL